MSMPRNRLNALRAGARKKAPPKTKKMAGKTMTKKHITKKKVNKKNQYPFIDVRKQAAFICARFTGDRVKNIINAIKIARAAHNAGFTPIVPHLNFLFLNADNPAEDRAAIKHCYKLIDAAEVFILEDRFGITENMKKEIYRARATQKNIIFAAALMPETQLFDENATRVIKKIIKTPFGDRKEI